MKLLFVVTHLLGSGHLSRILTLGRRFAQEGHHVCVASGGMPVPQLDHTSIELIQLPPLRSDGVDFTNLLDVDGVTADAQYLQTRSEALSEALTQLQPDVLITELFPFGRRSLKHEFQKLLEQARKIETPLILGSIRDILAPPSKQSKADFADQMVTDFYDGILVHAKADVTPLSLSWPVSDKLAPFLFYTGFVAPSPPVPHPQKAGDQEIIISAGGGDVGTSLFNVALQAGALDPTYKWRILIGGVNAEHQITELRAKAPKNVVIEAARPDFRQMLNHAKASVSMCGYNTAMDVLQTGVSAVFVPFDAGGEVEQTLRAKALSDQPNITVLANADLTPGTLLSAIESSVRSSRSIPSSDGFDGAANSVKIIAKMLNDRKYA